jgi:hypothetical protein
MNKQQTEVVYANAVKCHVEKHNFLEEFNYCKTLEIENTEDYEEEVKLLVDAGQRFLDARKEFKKLLEETDEVTSVTKGPGLKKTNLKTFQLTAPEQKKKPSKLVEALVDELLAHGPDLEPKVHSAQTFVDLVSKAGFPLKKGRASIMSSSLATLRKNNVLWTVGRNKWKLHQNYKENIDKFLNRRASKK